MSVDNATCSSPAGAVSVWPGWLAYLCFVIYGSLVPLDYHPRSLDDAWAAFRHLPMLEIGLQGRADWIANGVLFMPLAFLTASMVKESCSKYFWLSAMLGSLLFCSALAVCIEFVQLFFPPRTVSMNDVAAEVLGSLVGVAVAWRWTGNFRKLVGAFFGDPVLLRLRLLEAYALAYLILSLFPYDFLLSGAEFLNKLESDHWAWFLADKTVHGGIFLVLLKLAAEVLAAIPFGFLLSQRLSGRNDYLRGLILGAILGLCIEVAQFFVFSGISQGASVLTRSLAVGAGTWLWNLDWDADVLRAQLRRFGAILGSLYLLVLAAINGWFAGSWRDVELAAKKLGDLHFVPFYYHYYTSETIALVSLTSVFLMYAPVGIFFWAIRTANLWPAFAAALIAAIMEGGKLFQAGVHPDPTDIFIAALAAYATGWLLARLDATAPEIGKLPTPSAWRTPIGPVHVGLLLVMILLVWGVANFPFHPFLLGLLLVAFGILIWRRPPLLVMLIPAALPVFDLAPWSGRFYFDEFDLLIITGLAVAYARVPAVPRGVIRDSLFPALSALVGLSFVIGAVRGMLPWQVPDANSFSNYYSPYNALRIAKGALWAFLLYGLLSRFRDRSVDVLHLFARGMVFGLLGTVAVVIWERMQFSGLLNFSNDYRATGPFSQAHIGSAYIEAYLTAAVPFLVWLIFKERPIPAKFAGVLLLLASTYALMVTFSRSAYAAYGIALAIVCLAAWAQSARRFAAQFAAQLRRGLAALALMGLVLVVAMPIYKGSFAQARMSQVGADLDLRLAHWQDGLRMIAPDWATRLFGMGIGRYPEMHYWRSGEEVRAAGYRLETEDGNTFLRLGSGGAIYMEQVVAVLPQRYYLLSLDARASQANTSVKTWVCEKWLLASYECFSQNLALDQELGAWRHYQVRVASGDIGRGSWYARRPVKLALSNPTHKAAVDVDNVRLESADGVELLSNGDFSHGLDRWLFSVDDYWPWHIESLPLAILFDQGWLGFVAVGLIVALALGRATFAALRGQLAAAAILASLVGFLTVGLLNSLIDTPRFLLLFLLLLWFASHADQGESEKGSEVLPQRLRHRRS